jgi:small subunit ribosomal protein S20
MPHTRSAKKSLRKSDKRRLHNRATKKAIKTEIKKFLELLKSGSVDSLAQELKIVTKNLDKAAARRIVHRNMAARKKSQLARMLHEKSAAPAKP